MLKKRSRHYALVRRGSVLLYVTGTGEIERFMAVGKGQRLAMKTLGAKDLMTQSLTGKGVTLGGALTFTRITRELAEKGLPPYFLKIINSFRQVALLTRLVSSGIEIDLEVTQ